MAKAILLSKGRYRARIAQTGQDVAAAQQLRTLAFGTPTLDRDAFDATCVHILVEDVRADCRLVCCFRMLTMGDGAEIGRSYSAQFYDLSALEGFRGRMVEMGRFCIHPDCADPDILRVAWGAMTAYVDRQPSRDVVWLFFFRRNRDRGLPGRFCHAEAPPPCTKALVAAGQGTRRVPLCRAASAQA